MTPALWGAVLGGLVAMGVLLVVARIRAIRRPSLSVRVLPYLRDLPVGYQPAATRHGGAVTGVFGPAVRAAADAVERVLGGTTSVEQRLRRAGLEQAVHDFRVEQVVWGLVAFGIVAAYALVSEVRGGGSPVASLVLCLVAFALGVIGRDSWLTTQVRQRERRMLAEFPTVAELLALAVAAGEGPVPALDRVVRRSAGELSRELARVLAEVRTGQPVQDAFDAFAARTGLPAIARFAAGVAVAVERGTPLADVLHAQARDVREAGRRELIEAAARKEVLMMVPIVFLVLPIVVVFALWPGVIGLHLSAS